MKTRYTCDGCGASEAAGRYGTIPTTWQAVPIFVHPFGDSRATYKGLKRYCPQCKETECQTPPS